MGQKISANDGTEIGGVSASRSLRTVGLQPGPGFVTQWRTNTMNAALVGGGAVYSMRYSPSAGNRVAYITRIRGMYTTIAAFAAPVTANRSLYMMKFVGDYHSGGTAGGDNAALPKKNGASPSYFDSSLGGDMRIAGSTHLTAGGGVSILDTGWGHYRQSLTGHGAAGAYVPFCWGEGPAEPCTILAAGEGLIVTHETMDAGGTWQLSLIVEWYELAADWS